MAGTTHFFAGLPQNVHGSFRGACTGPHQDHEALGHPLDRSSRMVLAPGLLHETVHHVLHNCGASAVERVAGLACLEKRVGILRRAAQNGPVRGHGALAMLAHEIVIHHRAKIVIAHRGDHVHHM